jgi:hypothetical protein
MTTKLKAMIKQKICLLASLIFSCSIYNTAKAQVYSIESFDGTETKIKLTEILRGRVLAVNCSKDTVFLNDYTGIKDVHVLCNKFLQITYNTKGGTGSEVRNTLILCVIGKKINVSMLVASYASWFSSNPDSPSSVDEENLYTLKFNMIGNNKSNYKLIVNVHDEQKSKLHPKTNYIKNGHVNLSFDPGQNIFYSTYKSIAQSFTINDPKTQQSDKQEVGGTLPVIVLGRNSYYYVKSEWYGSGYDDNLFKSYYK